jgi:6-phospho-3-hexuloisomerase
MRLLHLGFHSYVLGDTIVPSISKGDVAIAISGSGRTQLILTAAEAAKKVGATVVAVTSYPDSPLGMLADLVVWVPGRAKASRVADFFARQILGIHEPLAPLGTLFEDTAAVFLDGVIYALMKELGVNEEEMAARHANIEL